MAARRGGTTLSFHRGDGAGGLLPPENLPLPGAVTALATGDVNRRDGLEDVLVGVATPTGPELLVFQWPAGALRGEPEAIPLPEPAADFAVGQMDDDYPIDIAVAAGSTVLWLSGRDRHLSYDEAHRPKVAQASIRIFHVKGQAVSVAIGDYDGDRRDDLAALTADGSVWRIPASDATGVPADPESIGEVSAGATGILSLRTSTTRGTDLLVVNPSVSALTLMYFPPTPESTGSEGAMTAILPGSGDTGDASPRIETKPPRWSASSSWLGSTGP